MRTGSAWTRRAAPAAAIALGVVTLGICAATVPLDSLIHRAGTGGPLADTSTNVVAVLPAVAVGTLLAARRPRNPIGWLILAIFIVGFSPTSQYLALDYGLHHGTLPLGGLAVLLQECWPMLLFFVAVLLWIFPDGRLPPGRWRRPAVVLVVAGVGWLAIQIPTDRHASGERRQQLKWHSGWSTGGSTAPATTPRPWWPRSPPSCGTRSTWIPSAVTCSA